MLNLQKSQKVCVKIGKVNKGGPFLQLINP